MIHVRAMRNGYRRGGVAHTQDGKTYPADFFTDEQLQQLNDDPMIVVEPVAVEIKTHPGTGEKMTGVKALADGDNVLDPEFTKLKDAARKAMEDGNTIGSGAPSIGAMEDILGADVTTAQRDAAWAALKEEDNA